MKEANNQIETDNLSQENVNATKLKISEGMDFRHPSRPPEGLRYIHSRLANRRRMNQLTL
jgi:hypothetical protein